MAETPDDEVADVGQLVSWLARQPRVRLDGPGDPWVGITGASYGGALAPLAAAYDHRIDAVVPRPPGTTWPPQFSLTPRPARASPRGPADGVFEKQWPG